MYSKYDLGVIRKLKKQILFAQFKNTREGYQKKYWRFRLKKRTLPSLRVLSQTHQHRARERKTSLTHSRNRLRRSHQEVPTKPCFSY